MAKKEDPKKEEVKDVDNDENENDEEAGAKLVEAAARKKKLMLLGIIGVVLLLAAGGGTWLALRMLNSDSAAPAEANAEAKAEQPGEKGKEKEKVEKPTHKKALYDVFDPPFLANYQIAGRPHYLQMSLAVMAREPTAIDAVHTHMPLLRNRIVILLSGEVFDQLQSDDGRVQLQQKLLAAIQEILKKETGKPQVEQVYYTNFVMQ